MTATTAPIGTTTGSAGSTRSLKGTTVRIGLVGAAAATAVAGLADAAGVPLAIDGEMIPLAGFAQMAFLGAVLGGVLAAVLRRHSGAARRRFVQATVVLTALSCIPSVALPPDAATKIVLVLTHLVAAAIIVPVLARRLDG